MIEVEEKVDNCTNTAKESNDFGEVEKIECAITEWTRTIENQLDVLLLFIV
jgi:hypothetical protein